MATATTQRYRTGTASVTQGSTKVIGLNTRWSTAGINPGANFYIDGIAYANEIKQVKVGLQFCSELKRIAGNQSPLTEHLGLRLLRQLKLVIQLHWLRPLF